MRKVLKSLVSFLVIATMLLSMASVSLAYETAGEIKLSTNGIEEVTFGGEIFTGVELTVTAVVPDDYFAGWDEGVVRYDGSLFEFAGYEAVDFADDWGDLNEWPLVDCAAYSATGEVKIGLGAYDLVPFGTQDVLKLYFKAIDAEAAAGQIATFNPFGNLVSIEWEEDYTAIFDVMETELSGAQVSFPEATPDVEVYTITYMIGDELYTTVEYEVGATVTPLAAPSKDGYTFNGWVGEPETMPANDVTVTGSFTEIPVIETSGSCGSNAFWSFDPETGVMTITGTGAMTDYSSSKPVPWLTAPTDFKDKITKVVISDGITKIGNRTFRNCANLAEIIIPASVTSIGSYAFQSAAVDSLELPNPNVAIGSYAFGGLLNLTDVAYSGTKAQYDVFAAAIPAGNLELQRAAITVTDPSTGAVVAHAGMNIYATWVYDVNTKILEIGNCPTEKAKDMLNFQKVELVPWAAYVKDVVEVKINGVGLVGSRTMQGASSLKKAEVNSGTRINSWAFFNAKALETITVPATLTAIGTGAFNGTDALELVTTLGTLDEYASINIGANNTSFERETVEATDGVKGWHSNKVNWTLKDGLLTLTGSGAMADNRTSYTDQPWYPYADQINSIDISNKITSIGRSAFYNLTNVTELTLPASVTTLAANSLRGMTGLTTLNVQSPVITLGTRAVEECNALATINYNGSADDYATGVKVGSANNSWKTNKIVYAK